MKEHYTALVIGATGLVGQELMQQLIADPSVSKIKSFVRRPGIQHEKVEEHIVDFDDVKSFATHLQGDVLYSCMGTTIKTAGSKKAQYKVDYTYQYEVASMSAEQGVPHYVLVSSAQASTKSIFFYSRMKGRLEKDVVLLPFKGVAIMRPSVLMGERKQKRLGEASGAKIINTAARFIGPLAKYRGIKGETVASGMIKAYQLLEDQKPIIYEYDEIFELVDQE